MVALFIASTLFSVSLRIEGAGDTALSLTQENTFLSLIIKWFPQLGQDHLIALAILTLFFAVIRFTEALGLWFDKNWGEQLAIATGFLAIFLLVSQLLISFSWFIFLILNINIFVLLYLYSVLKNKKLHTKKIPKE